MKGLGYAATAGAFLALALGVSQWFIIGTAVFGLLAWWRFFKRGPVCDCYAGNQPVTIPRRGGAVWGCPVHDPGHTDERRKMLREAR
jgi:hypothetical protein